MTCENSIKNAKPAKISNFHGVKIVDFDSIFESYEFSRLRNEVP